MKKITPSTLTSLAIHTETASVNSSGEYVRFYCYFPESGAFSVHQTGEVMSPYSKGLTVSLFQRKGNPAPHAFDFCTDDEEQYADGGLWYESTAEGTRITEYDGVFNIPREVVAMLKALGFNTEYIE